MLTRPTIPAATIITPPRRWPGLGIGELWRHRHVLFVLARRQHKAQYGNLVLGAVWVVLEPLLLTVIVASLLGLIMGRGDQMGIPFPVFLFIGWTAIRPFQRLVSIGGSSIRGNNSLVDRVYLPRAYFPLSVALVSLVDLAAMGFALTVLLFLYGISPGIGMVMLPVLLMILYAFSLGLAFFFAAASMALPDVDMVKMLFVRTWFWLSPVIYPSDIVPEEFRNLYYLNPMAIVIEGLRWALAQTPAPPLEAWLIGASTAGIALVFGYLYFRRRDPYFPDEL
jgi:lipopolysaccharide transport system permease protein